MVHSIPGGKWIALVIFIIASITDTLDGQIARRKNLVTNFGKFMDPLADKLLVCSAMIAMIEMDRLPAWIVIIIIAREFIISGFRLVASDNGVVIAAGWWGKIKTVVQMIMVIVLICDFGGSVANLIENILIYAALALTIISLIDYLVKNKDVISDFK
jgi:CDP-diacylglycerol--glycerol-3-phosphate 3-phosphatidyltransferase